jgi:radical SAM-linked protein
MRIRVTFSKTGPLKYIGHLDLQALWERAVRRAGLPLAYTQGFHPQPKINHASALPLGFSSRCEVVDLRLDRDVEITELPARLQAAMPSGLGILKVEVVDDHGPALPTQVLAAEYEVTLTGGLDVQDLKRKMIELLARPTLARVRRDKKYDLRPLIEDLRLVSETTVSMRLAAREGATGRPDEVLAELGIPIENAQIERVRLLFQ